MTGKKPAESGSTDLLAKALRRAKKLERTLGKIVALDEPGSPLEQFLKDVQSGAAILKKASKSRQERKAQKAAKAEQAKLEKKNRAVVQRTS